MYYTIFFNILQQSTLSPITYSLISGIIYTMIDFNEDKQEFRLKKLRQKEEDDVVKLLAHKYSIPYVDLSTTPIEGDALRLLKEPLAREAKVAAFNLINKKVAVAVRKPESPEAEKALSVLREKGYKPDVFITSTKSLEAAWSRYADIRESSGATGGLLDVASDDIRKLSAQVKTVGDVQDLIGGILKKDKKYRISRVVEVLTATALGLNASDIHIEPEEKDVRLRFRLDGLLTDIAHFDHETHKFILSRIKLLSGLKLNVQKEAQDGRFSIHLGDTEIEIRTSTLPGNYGESIVMRLLNPDAILTSIEELGMLPYYRTIIEREIEKPNGMILITGPTGSGKTTTLYSILRKIHNPAIKIITIEDPIEYHLGGIVQTQTNREKDYTFSSGLRAALRQDPDVIMVGEIRDNETAEIAINAALTGHLVLSTLHTNTAAGSFPRLIDLGVNPKVISSAINVSVAQRLVRHLCTACKKEIPLTPEQKEKVTTIFSGRENHEAVTGLQQETIFEAVGCSECNDSGYKGRVGIFEAVLTDTAVEQLIAENPSEHELMRVSEPQNILTMQQDGVVKVLRGDTTPEELERVLGAVL